MVALSAGPTPAPATSAAPRRPISLAATASMVIGGAVGVIWIWIPLAILIAGISSIPSGVGFALAAIVFIYLMRGVERMERVRSEAVFGLGIAVPYRRLTGYRGVQGWLHQLWLDVSSARFWKSVAHHYVRLAYDIAATGIAFALVAFGFLGPAATVAIGHSDADIGLWSPSPVLAWLLAVVAVVAAAAILVFAPTLDAAIDRRMLSPSPAAALRHQVDVLDHARVGAVSSAQTERHRIERDLHDSVQPRLVSLAMAIGLAQTKLDSDLPAARQLIAEAHDEAKHALVDLRNVVRGIAPTILADRGLDAALSAVVQRAETSGVPTTLDLHLPRRLPEEVEAVAYFVVAEALTNVAKHAQATQAVVTVRLDESDDTVHVSVFDDGRGGAAITQDENATGLRGLDERVRAARGTLWVSSPVTGPTIVSAVLPCAS